MDLNKMIESMKAHPEYEAEYEETASDARKLLETKF